MNLTGKYVKLEFRGGRHDGETMIVPATDIPRELYLPYWFGCCQSVWPGPVADSEPAPVDRYAATDSEFTYDVVTVNEAHVRDEPDFLTFMLQDARPFVLMHQG